MALAAAGIAYTIAMRVLPWLGERANVTVPKEIEPVVVVLLLGLVTDYSIFFLSETRRRLRAGDERLPAARAAVAEVAPIVVTAGLIVAAGTAALVVGHLQFFRAFGPGLAATTLITLAVSVTLVPALVALFGPRLFGASAAARAGRPPPPDTDARRRTRAGPSGASSPLRLTRPVDGRARAPGELAARAPDPALAPRAVARIASSRPVALADRAHRHRRCWSSPPLNVALDRARAEPRPRAAGGRPRSRRADDAASRGFAPGIVSPDRGRPRSRPAIAGRAAQLARLQALVGRQPGVAAVVGPREQPPPPAPQVMVSARRGRRAPGRRLRQRPARRPGDRPPAQRCATACRACCAAPG